MSRRPTRLAAGLTAALTGAVLFGAPSASAGPENRSERAPERAEKAERGPAPLHGTSKKDRYIVVFDKGAGRSSVKSARADARGRGAEIHHTYSTVLDGFAATLPARALNGLRNNPNVAYIEADQQVTATDVQSPATWGLDRIDQRSLPLTNSYTYDRTGAGVTAYVIDTGIRTGHAEFGGRAVSGYTAINDGRGSEDCNGHGTHVAGTVGGETYGVAKDVTLVAVRVLNCQGSGTNSGVIAGVDWVTQNASGAAVANMSLGGSASSALDTAVSNSVASGVTYAVAAGNDNRNACNYSPARVGNALTVGSTTSSDGRSSFSNYGSCLDLFAPGSNITSAWHTGDTATNTISGTSMASPHVAGVAALYLQGNPSASPSTVNSAVTSTATSGVVGNAGSGSPNLLLHSLFGGTTPTPDPEPEPDPTGCDLPEQESGSLSGAGDLNYHPGSSGYYYSGAGAQVGCLDGPNGVDFDLHLEKWNGYSWVVVARSISSGPDESLTYNGSAGYYSWRVESYTGSGSYTFGLDRP